MTADIDIPVFLHGPLAFYQNESISPHHSPRKPILSLAPFTAGKLTPREVKQHAQVTATAPHPTLATSGFGL